MTLSLPQIRQLKTHLDTSYLPDAQIWPLITSCFFGLLRVGNVTVPTQSNWDSNKILTRSDIAFTPAGCVLAIKHSKTNQYRERVFLAVLLHLASDPCCPTLVLLSLLNQAGNPPAICTSTICYLKPDGCIRAMTPAVARERLNQLFKDMGLIASDYGSHSLRRSGTSHLLMLNVPVETIKVLGDWKSDCVFKYLKPTPESKLMMLQD